MKPYFGRLVRAKVTLNKVWNKVTVRVYHVPTGATLATDNTGAQAWQKMVNYGRRHAEAYEIVLRHGSTVQTLEGRFIAFASEKELV